MRVRESGGNRCVGKGMKRELDGWGNLWLGKSMDRGIDGSGNRRIGESTDRGIDGSGNRGIGESTDRGIEASGNRRIGESTDPGDATEDASALRGVRRAPAAANAPGARQGVGRARDASFTAWTMRSRSSRLPTIS